ncbi:MAG TPA: citrate synthase [Magnetospirillaceae bacterium]|jgi:citrate synthase
MASGLDGVVAAETVLSHVDGEAGRLILRGHDLETLAGHAGFEDVVAVLWQGIVPTDDLRHMIAAARQRAFARFAPMLPHLNGLTATEAMRALLAALPDTDFASEPAALLGAAGTAAALAIRSERGEAPVTPDAALPHAADLLRMIRGTAGDETEIAGLDTYLVTVMDHGLNASTFAARVVASTAAGLPSSIVAGLCALKGPLHGGAPGPVLDMLDAIGAADHAEAWIGAALDRGERLMGFGHRIYQVRDPRADVLKAAIRRLHHRTDRIQLAEAVEAAALRALRARKTHRRLDTNVEYYTAVLLEALGIPREGFTPVFGAARTAGWIAHAREQEQSGRLIRPLSRYTGPMPTEAA